VKNNFYQVSEIFIKNLMGLIQIKIESIKFVKFLEDDGLKILLKQRYRKFGKTFTNFIF
jgi:hypothetical protein